MNSEKKPTEKDYLEDDYLSLDITSATECTGMVPTPPLTEAEAEGYSDICSMPQKKASQAAPDGRALRQSK